MPFAFAATTKRVPSGDQARLVTCANGSVTFRPCTTTVVPARYASLPSADHAGSVRFGIAATFVRPVPSGNAVHKVVGAVLPFAYAIRVGPHATVHVGMRRSVGVPPPAATSIA